MEFELEFVAAAKDELELTSYGLSFDSEIDGKMLSAGKKEERPEFKIENISSYFCVGEFTKSFIFGTVRVLLRKPNR